MVISRDDLVRRYGAAVVRDAAALFVGAGLSVDSGLPDWDTLLRELRHEARIPDEVGDLPLVAEYTIQQLDGGEDRLVGEIARQIVKASPEPHDGHRIIARLNIDDVWTTNYDWMIEAADPERITVSSDNQVPSLRNPGRRRLTKMHGSLNVAGEWESKPVISRTDYERYRENHPQIWATLEATYLTKSILFLGFSFSDPNIEILLSLSRRLGGSAPRHYTVLRRPADPSKLRLHDLRVLDLESTGVEVCEIDEFSEINALLAALERRSRRPILFITGSDPADGQPVKQIAELIGHNLAGFEQIQLSSFAGPGGMTASLAFNYRLESESRYKAERTRFLFRKRDSRGTVPVIEDRIGMAIYTGMDLEAMRRYALSESRAIIAIGGNKRVRDELELAIMLGLPCIPVAHSGGASREAWGNGLPSSIPNGEELAPAWENLASDNPLVAAQAAAELVGRAMYLDADQL